MLNLLNRARSVLIAYVAANSVEEDKKVSEFLSVIGLDMDILFFVTYVLHRTKAIMIWSICCFEPEPSVITERFYFNKKNQSLSKYASTSVLR